MYKEMFSAANTKRDRQQHKQAEQTLKKKEL